MYMRFQHKTVRFQGSKLVTEDLGLPVIGRGNYRAAKQEANRNFAAALNSLMRSKREVFRTYVISAYNPERSKLTLKG